MKPLKYREQVVQTATEILASKLERKDDRRQRDLPKQLVNSNESGNDLYAKPEVPDTKGYPGWITGNGAGPSMDKGAYATRPMTLAPETDIMRSGMPYRFGSWLADQATGKPRLRPVGNYLSDIGTRPGAAAAKGGLGGAAIGMGAGLLTGHGATLGGGLGALLGSLGSYGAGFLTKASTADGVGYLLQRLDTDFDISASTRELLSDAVQRLVPHQANALADLVRMSFGAGLASVIAHYLFKLGLVGTSIFALIGAGAAYGLGQQNRNAFGERVQSGTDPFGRPL